MSRDFARITVEQLLSWILKEEAEGAIFGISRNLFYQPEARRPFTFTRYNQVLETPIGVAAGPHTQMAQNLIAAWLCGARYLELKTVQTLDQLTVSKPCIDMQDEGYNCEWSQELRLDDSFDEYLNAWIVMHILRHKFDWKNDKGPGFIFNMSVGYNMEGILKENVQRFLDRMENCRKELSTKVASLAKIYPKISEIAIPERMSDNITLSTMHGCPPEEIEKIGLYLINQRKLHTTIKLNPTLLGPAELRSILNDRLGFEAHIPDEAFGHDLKYPDAIKLIENLRDASNKEGLHFSLKLTNTLESVNHKDVFPAQEKMMYMSGRALHPISINVAAKLQNHFDGQLDLTFSAGADCFNLPEIIACGIRPVTVCSDILKPGGYGRLGQYLEELETRMKTCGADSIEAFIKAWDGCGLVDVRRAALRTLRQYSGVVSMKPEYKKDAMTGETIKTRRELTPFDCIQAPCVNTCPAHQDIPSYLYCTAIGDYQKAYEVIVRTNPFPNVLGMVCDHQCQHKCTRMNYDSSILIREVKRFIAAQNEHGLPMKPAKANGMKVAIIGAGPSGLACAYFLVLEGYEVAVYETKTFSGGMVSDAIPRFRLTSDSIEKDIKNIQGMGVKMVYDSHITKDRFAALRAEYDFIYVAIGAQKAKPMGVPGESGAGVIDCLKFLSDVRRGNKVHLGERVAIIGGGNSAMDAARTALRLVEAKNVPAHDAPIPQKRLDGAFCGGVTVVYRRTRKEMPADREEITALLDEGIEIRELTAPVGIDRRDGKVTLKCQKMELGPKGADGRASCVPVRGSDFDLVFDTVIPAIGQDVVPEFIDAASLRADPVTGMTKLRNVFAGGDAVRGAATIIKAIADGKTAAENIIRTATQKTPSLAPGVPKGETPEDRLFKSARRARGVKLPEIETSHRKGFQVVVRTLSENEALHEARRCLHCQDVCNVCVTVCPNRANRAYKAVLRDYTVFRARKKNGEHLIEAERTFRIAQENQVLNIGDFCNECGNCTTFCPTAGSPYKDKPKFYLTDKSFMHEENAYRLEKRKLRARIQGKAELLAEELDKLIYRTEGIEAVLDPETLVVERVTLSGSRKTGVVLDRPLWMGILYKSLKNSSFAD